MTMLRRISMSRMGADENGSDQPKKIIFVSGSYRWPRRGQPNKDFLLLFCKKEVLPYFPQTPSV
jgi:hypothetical protein